MSPLICKTQSKISQKSLVSYRQGHHSSGNSFETIILFISWCDKLCRDLYDVIGQWTIILGLTMVNIFVYAWLCNEELDCVTVNSAEEQCSVRNIVGEILSSDVRAYTRIHTHKHTHTHTNTHKQTHINTGTLPQSTVGRGKPNKWRELKKNNLPALQPAKL
jgi:hypothetical protein